MLILRSGGAGGALAVFLFTGFVLFPVVVLVVCALRFNTIFRYLSNMEYIIQRNRKCQMATRVGRER
jgi:hypothetical protein